MKRLAAFAIVAAFATSASAASIMWGFGGKVYLYDGETDTAILASDASAPAVNPDSYLALVYLGQNVESYTLAGLTKDIDDPEKAASVVDTLDYAIVTSGKSNAIGKWDPNSNTYADADMVSGASFTILFFNADSSTFEYVYALDGTTKGKAYDKNILTVTSDNMTIANASIYATGGTGSTPGVVPEPSVAILGLIGLGMLIRRRKA